MAYIVDAYKSCDTCDKDNCKHGKYYILRDSKGNYLETLSSDNGGNYYSMRSSVSERDDVTVEDAFEDFNVGGEYSNNTKERSIQLTEDYLEYIGDYEESIEPLNQKQFGVDEYKILDESVREDLYRNAFEAQDIDYKYAQEIFSLVEGCKADTNPHEDMRKLESIIAYANDQEPELRGDLEPYRRDELDDELVEAMNIISGVNYGVIKKLYGDNPEVYRTNHSYSQSKILNSFLSNPDDKINYDDNTFVNYTMANEVVEVFSGDVISTVEVNKDNLLYSPDITFPIDMNRNELEVNLNGKDLELNSDNVTFEGERLSNKVDYNGLKNDPEFIQSATKKIMRGQHELDKTEKDEFAKNVVRLESKLHESIDSKRTLESLRYDSSVLNNCIGALNPPNVRSIQRGDTIIVNGKEQKVESVYDEGYEVSVETYNEDKGEYNIVMFENNITTDDMNNPMNVEIP